MHHRAIQPCHFQQFCRILRLLAFPHVVHHLHQILSCTNCIPSHFLSLCLDFLAFACDQCDVLFVLLHFSHCTFFLVLLLLPHSLNILGDVQRLQSRFLFFPSHGSVAFSHHPLKSTLRSLLMLDQPLLSLLQILF